MLRGKWSMRILLHTQSNSGAFVVRELPEDAAGIARCEDAFGMSRVTTLPAAQFGIQPMHRGEYLDRGSVIKLACQHLLALSRGVSPSIICPHCGRLTLYSIPVYTVGRFAAVEMLKVFICLCATGVAGIAFAAAPEVRTPRLALDHPAFGVARAAALPRVFEWMFATSSADDICKRPNPVDYFPTSEPKMYMWIYISGAGVGDTLEVDYTFPSGRQDSVTF